MRDELKECHIDTTWQKFEKGVFTLKTNQMSFVCTMPKEFFNHRLFLDLCLRKSLTENHVIIVKSSLLKSSVHKMFSVHIKIQSQRFFKSLKRLAEGHNRYGGFGSWVP